MIKSIVSHWRGEQGFWQTCLINGIVGGLIALIVGFILGLPFILIPGVLQALGTTPSHLIALCTGIPFLIYFIWLYVGMFRYGLRVLRDKDSTRLNKTGGLIAILLVAYFVIVAPLHLSKMIAATNF